MADGGTRGRLDTSPIVGWVDEKEVGEMVGEVFVWSDELALILTDAGDASLGQLNHWIAFPTGYRLSEHEDPLSFARQLLTQETTRERQAS